MDTRLLFVIYLTTLWEVHSIHVEGPALTRYRPCGLGPLHFDKLNGNKWQGVIDLRQYDYLSHADIVIIFKEEMNTHWPSALPNVTMLLVTEEDKETRIVLDQIPLNEKLVFEVEPVHTDSLSNGVPLLSNLTLNRKVICNENIKTAQRVPSGGDQVCGRRSIDRERLLTGRTEARAGDWPWHVAVFDDNNYDCGGNIISSTAVLTVGFCVDSDNVKVVAGIRDIYGYNSIGRQELSATSIIRYPQFVNDPSKYNLAIVKVDKFIFTVYVQPICLWGPEYTKADLREMEAMFAGFGRTKTINTSKTLRSTDLTVLDDSVCKNNFKSNNEFRFCTAAKPNIIGRGDAGGGFVVSTIGHDHTITWWLQGIQSNCIIGKKDNVCDENQGFVFTQIAPFYAWIYHHSGL